MKRELTEALKNVLFNDCPSSPSRKAQNIISLCGYYGLDEMSDTLQLELEKLQLQLPQFLAIDNFIELLKETNSREFKSDDSGILAEIEKNQKILNQPRVNMAILISHIGKMARKAGDISFEENN